MTNKEKEDEEKREIDRQQRLQAIKDKDERRKKQIKDNEQMYRDNLKKIDKVPMYK